MDKKGTSKAYARCAKCGKKYLEFLHRVRDMSPLCCPVCAKAAEKNGEPLATRPPWNRDECVDCGTKGYASRSYSVPWEEYRCAECEAYRKAERQSEERLRHYKEHIQDLEDTNKRLEAVATKMAAGINLREGQAIHERIGELLSMEDQTAGLRRVVDNQRRAIESMAEELNQLRAHKEGTDQELSAVKDYGGIILDRAAQHAQELAKVHQRMGRMKDQIQQAAEEEARLIRENEALAKAGKDLQDRNKDLQNGLQSTLRNLADARAVIASDNKELRELKESLKDRGEQVERLVKANDRLRASERDLGLKVCSLTDQLTKLQRENKLLVDAAGDNNPALVYILTEALEHLAQRGLCRDLNPTRHGFTAEGEENAVVAAHFAEYAWWSKYMKEADQWVRDFAKEALRSWRTP